MNTTTRWHRAVVPTVLAVANGLVYVSLVAVRPAQALADECNPGPPSNDPYCYCGEGPDAWCFPSSMPVEVDCFKHSHCEPN